MTLQLTAAETDELVDATLAGFRRLFAMPPEESRREVRANALKWALAQKRCGGVTLKAAAQIVRDCVAAWDEQLAIVASISRRIA